MPNKGPKPRADVQSKNRYRRAAKTLAVLGGAGLGGPFLLYAWQFHGALAPNSEAWAHAGEYMAGIAGSTIALATLVALAITLSLQEEELQKTREALDTQIKNSAEQLATLRQQLDDTRVYESRRIRPVLKAEWLQGQGSPNSRRWRIVNVGLGPCVLDGVDLVVSGLSLGGHDFTANSNAHGVWTNAINQALGGAFAQKWSPRWDISQYPIHELKRVLAVGEAQEVIYVRLAGYDLNAGAAPDIPWHQLDRVIEPTIRFRSLTGEQFNTKTQLDLAS